MASVGTVELQLEANTEDLRDELMQLGSVIKMLRLDLNKALKEAQQLRETLLEIQATKGAK